MRAKKKHFVENTIECEMKKSILINIQAVIYCSKYKVNTYAREFKLSNPVEGILLVLRRAFLFLGETARSLFLKLA